MAENEAIVVARVAYPDVKAAKEAASYLTKDCTLLPGTAPAAPAVATPTSSSAVPAAAHDDHGPSDGTCGAPDLACATACDECADVQSADAAAYAAVLGDEDEDDDL